MRVFRLARKKYKIELSGKGAARSGNRWNSKGTEIIYCAESRSLSMAEVAVHLTLATLPSDYVMLEIDIPDDVSESALKIKSLPIGWEKFPHIIDTQNIGDDFVLSAKTCVLKVSSAVVPGDYNFLINPSHPDFKKIRIVTIKDFPFDERLFR